VSSLSGVYSTATRIERRTYFRWSFAGDATYPAGVSTPCVAKCWASLTSLGVPSIVRSGVKYTCHGLLKPQHAGGKAPLTITFYRYRSGSWRSMASVKDSRWVNVSGATRYAVWFVVRQEEGRVRAARLTLRPATREGGGSLWGRWKSLAHAQRRPRIT